MATILCAADDHLLTDLLCYALTRQGFRVHVAHKGRQAQQIMRMEPIDLVLLDANLPDISGVEVLASLRKVWATPVVMLSPSTPEEDVIAWFQRGADGYMARPFNMQVLIAQITAILRRVESLAPTTTAAAATGTIYHLPGVHFDAGRNQIVSQDRCLALTPCESRILHLLCLHRGRVFSAERILEQVWGYDSASSANVVKSHIARLRFKISTLSDEANAIRTLPGAGYMVPRDDASNAAA